MEFSREITIRLFDTDASGLIFFGAQFRIAHEVYEEFAAHLGYPLAAVLREGKLLLPIVHAEADFAAPLAVGDRVTVWVAVARIGEHSFALRYRLEAAGGTEAGRVDLVHAVIDAATRRPVCVPEELRGALEPYLVGKIEGQARPGRPGSPGR
jgi:1,4-dihydroxy-2-naphthoyl-CoA hydrolase